MLPVEWAKLDVLSYPLFLDLDGEHVSSRKNYEDLRKDTGGAKRIYRHEPILVWLYERNRGSCWSFVSMNSVGGKRFKCCRCERSCDAVISITLVKGGPVHPLLKEIGKEALKYLSLAFRGAKCLNPNCSWQAGCRPVWLTPLSVCEFVSPWTKAFC